MSSFHSLQIKNIIAETATSVSICFDVPSKLAADFKFIAGQYLTLKTTINGADVRRSYSICSSPDSGELCVAIKQLKGGLFSTFATTQLKAGDFLDAAPPEGKFILQTNKSNSNHYCAFAAGSGITPVIAMIKTVLTHEKNSSFALLYGSKTPKDTIFYNALNDLSRDFPDRFYCYFVFSQTNENNALSGRIDAEKVNDILKNKHQYNSFHSFYICGPEQMVTTVSETLISNNITKEQINYELFTATTKDNPQTESADFSGTAQVTILVDDEETTITVKENQTILEAALKADIDAPYSCQGGVCSSCMCMVTSGEVHLLKNSILTDDELEEGLSIACQAIPKSSNITIDFDNV